MSDIEREAFERIERQFTSGNSVSVDRASVRKEDWEAAKKYAARQAPASGEVEPVGVVDFSGVVQWFKPYTSPPAGTEIFTHPPAKVPEGWKIIRMPDFQKAIMTGPVIGVWGPNDENIIVVSDSDERRERNLYALLDALLTTPTPATTAETEWVKCSDRLPTEGDWWVWIYDSEDGDIFHALWRDLKNDYKNGHTNLSHWKPTGLKRPTPPQEQ